MSGGGGVRSALPELLLDLVRGGGQVADGEEKLRGGEKGWKSQPLGRA